MYFVLFFALEIIAATILTPSPGNAIPFNWTLFIAGTAVNALFVLNLYLILED